MTCCDSCVINCLSPDLCATDFYQDFPEEERERLSNLPALSPNDVCNAVEYLLSTPADVQIQDLVIRAWCHQ